MDRVSKGETRTVDGPCGPCRSGVPIVSQPHPKPTQANTSKSLGCGETNRKTKSHATKPRRAARRNGAKSAWMNIRAMVDRELLRDACTGSAWTS